MQDFDNLLNLNDMKKPRVGVVGEILVKFLPAANNHLVDLLEAEGAEAVVPDLLDFLLYCFYNQNFKAYHLGMKKSTARLGQSGYPGAGMASGSLLRKAFWEEQAFYSAGRHRRAGRNGI